MAAFEVKLDRFRDLSKTTRDFRFLRTDNESTPYAPGQFFRFRFRDHNGEFERPYSLCNFGEQTGVAGHLDLVISTVQGGRASKLLWQAKTGLKATVTGPFGRLLMPEPLPERLFLVATSVGIAPYLPILSQLTAVTRGEQTYLLYGTRDRTEFVYGDELMRFAEQHAWFNLSVCYSRELPADQRTFEYPGYVQHRLNDLRPDPQTDHVLLCGNPVMIDETYDLLKQKAFPVRQVVREKYVFAKQTSAGKKQNLTAAQKQLIARKMAKYRK